MTVKTEMYERIEKHGNQLNVIFDTKIEPIDLCKKLRRLENKASQLTTMACNGEVEMGLEYEAKLQSILNSVNKILTNTHLDTYVPIFINQDSRGYALKIKDSYVRENNLVIDRDWGGYGIIAPDLS